MPTLPTSGTEVRFMSGIPFTSDYKHTRWFASKAEQETYFNNQTVRHTESEVVFTGSKENRANRNYVTIDVSYDDVYDVNYFMFNNIKYMNRWFYAFVTKIEYVNSARTRLYFEIDVIQTWMFEIEFQPSYVKREHQTEYRSNGKPVINTIPEKLDYGTDYDTLFEYHYNPFEGLQWLVIQAKQEIHTVEEGDQQISPSFIGAPQPLVTYLYPVNRNGSGRFPFVEVSYFEKRFTEKSSKFEQPVEEILKEIYKNESAVNNVVNIFLTENTGLPMSVDPIDEEGNEILVRFKEECFIQGREIGEDKLPLLQVTFSPTFHYLAKVLFNQYEVIDKPDESKLLMYPYTVLIMDDFRGNRVEYKMEYIDGEVEVISRGSVGVNNKTSYALRRYNKLSAFASIEAGSINDSPHDIAIVNDYTSAYMQGNANSLRNRLDSATFSGVTNTIGSALSAIGSVPSGGAIKGGGAGVVTGGMQSINNVVQTAGQSVLNIQGIDAQMKDIDNMPPNLVKMGGNIAFSFGNLYSGVRFMIKQIKPEYFNKLKGFFKSYGYKSNRVKVPNIRTRTAFNYVETEGCNIKGNIPNEDLNDIKSIFDGGITLWHVNDVGNYNVTNGVR